MVNKYDKFLKKTLRLATRKKSQLNEGRLPYNGTERMHKQLEEELHDGKTSLGKNPILPEGDEVLFTERIMTERFNDVVSHYKRTFDVDEIDDTSSLKGMQGIVNETMGMEKQHQKKLVEIAINMVREEYDMSEDLVTINAEFITPNEIDVSEVNNTMTPQIVEMEFEDTAQMDSTSVEVDKRRFINAMTQGAAIKTNHMYHKVTEELTQLTPRLPNLYNKMMSSTDYVHMTQPNLNQTEVGGSVEVDMPHTEDDTPTINAKAVTFPVLVHEIVKGVMEILSAHALPEDNKLAEYTMNKADYGAAELWDMRMGPALWERFTNLIEVDDFNVKHHIYAEMCSLPTNEFVESMREIMANTKKGKSIIESCTKKIKREMSKDEHNQRIEEMDEDLFNPLTDLNPDDLT